MRRVAKFMALIAVAGLVAGFGCEKKAPAPAEEVKEAVEGAAPAPVQAAPAVEEEEAPAE